jgi:gliding motility-associated-like protein
LPSGSIFPLGASTIVYEAIDIIGNTSTCSFTITVQDTENPEVFCTPSYTVNKDESFCGAVVNYVPPIGFDNCSNLTTTMLSGLGSGSVFPVGVNEEVYEISDATGNKTMCSFTITVQDTDFPTIDCPADITVNNTPGICGAVVNYIEPVGVDECGNATTVRVAGLASGSEFPTGVTTVTYEVTDAGGNTTICSFTVTVIDTEMPVITCSDDLVVTNDPGSCGAVVNYTIPVGVDNCLNATTRLVSGLASGSEFPVGESTVVYEVEDLAGNIATCSFKVTVNKTVGPQIVCPSDIIVNKDATICGAVVNYVAPIGVDNCLGVANTVLISGLGSGSVFPIGETIETYETSDISGNTNICSFTVTVLDPVAPTIVCPNDTTIYSDASQCGTLYSYSLPLSTANCGSTNTSLISGLGSGEVFPVGSNVEEYETYDVSGNRATCSFVITVADTISPVIVCPDDVEMESAPAVCGAIIDYDLPFATDNCSSTSIMLLSGLGKGANFPLGVNIEEYGAIDAAGNMGTCTFKVTIKDTQGLVITCPKDTVVLSDGSLCGALVDYNVPIGITSCGIPTTVLYEGLGTGYVFPNGISTEKYAVFDVTGNMKTCSFTIEVKDTVGPVMTCVNDIVECFTSNEQIVTYTTPTATGGCGNVSVTQTTGLPSGAIYPIGTTVNTFVAKDENGNESICTFTVTITDHPEVSMDEVNTCIAASEFLLTGGKPEGGSYEIEGVRVSSFNPATFGVGSFDLKYVYQYGNGCTRAVSSKLNVYRDVKATLDPFEKEYNSDDDEFELSGGKPEGGSFRGTGIVDNKFYPRNAEVGMNAVIYTYIDNGGCRYSATGYITVIESKELVVYNAFTPNGDGMHDTWVIKNIHKYPGAKIEVYNRWGTKVYESNNYNNNWNGGNLPDATYFYIVDLKTGEKPLTGTLTIIR